MVTPSVDGGRAGAGPHPVPRPVIGRWCWARPEVATIGAHGDHPLRAVSVSTDKADWLAANLQPDMDVFVRTAVSAWQVMPPNNHSHAAIVTAQGLGLGALANVGICR
jgi:hypothetical protein